MSPPRQHFGRSFATLPQHPCRPRRESLENEDVVAFEGKDVSEQFCLATLGEAADVFLTPTNDGQVPALSTGECRNSQAPALGHNVFDPSDVVFVAGVGAGRCLVSEH